MKQSIGAVSRQSKMQKIQQRFETWRKNRSSKRDRIPEELWEAAISLYGEYKISEISKELGLGGGPLKKRILDTAEKKTNLTPTFIKLDIPKSEPKQSGWSIEMENAHGKKMKMSGNGLEAPDFTLICQSFLRCNG